MEIYKTVSNLKTPKEYIKQKMGFDHVQLEYMRYVADKYYPGWTWRIIIPQTIVVNEYQMYEKINGQLSWIADGERFTSDMVAAHRIQFKTSKDNSNIKELVDPGNDTKAANTDCLKKAFNIYLHICDDVYRMDRLEITKEQSEKLLSLMPNDNTDEWNEHRGNIKTKINNLIINKKNYDESCAYLKYEIKKMKG